jgi:LiaF transmembrane domain
MSDLTPGDESKPMSDPTPGNEPQSNLPNQPEYVDRREERRRERELRREARWSRRGGGWFAGAVLILLGVIFLLENAGLLTTQNWWALFILIPAFGAFSEAWNHYQDAGNHLTSAVRGALFVGLILVLVTFAFLFGVSGALFWPALLIVAGLGLLANAMLR